MGSVVGGDCAKAERAHACQPFVGERARVVLEHVLFYTDLSNRLVLLDVDKGLAVNLSWVAKFSNSSHGLAFNSKSLITVMADKTLLIWKGNQWSRRRHGKSEKVIMSAGVLHTRP
eukprot:comp15613_c0_seq1/m.12736 comp15613_c0_seq1/g.12736  ORF comp15613_c0_seq1/g.12736 comp15613_c0_seq1/m.12736 type:complete len:116 (-) comp15613_c0_seq1:119-466(-)